jgi:hypothetical protein
MKYESPTVELLGDNEMANVQGEGVVWYASIAVVYAAAALVGIIVAAIGIGLPVLFKRR